MVKQKSKQVHCAWVDFTPKFKGEFDGVHVVCVFGVVSQKQLIQFSVIQKCVCAQFGCYQNILSWYLHKNFCLELLLSHVKNENLLNSADDTAFLFWHFCNNFRL